MITPEDIRRDIFSAHLRIKSHIHETPARLSPFLSEAVGGEVFLKQENQQVTGSFKIRGALNKLLLVRDSGNHVVAASTGNHARAVAHACAILGLGCDLFLPESANSHKVRALAEYPCTLHFVSGDAVNAELEARRHAVFHNHVFVSPYNDPDIISGQGTIGLELFSQVPCLDNVLVTVGGGGMISGIAAESAHTSPETLITGCSPVASPVMQESVRHGQILSMPSGPTLSDGSAGGLEPDAITFPLCMALVKLWIHVSESQIAHAMRILYQVEGLVVEGSAAVPVAALLKNAAFFSKKRVAIVLCGGNIHPDKFRDAIN